MHCAICNERLPEGQKWPEQDLCPVCKHEIQMTTLDNQYQDSKENYLEFNG